MTTFARIRLAALLLGGVLLVQGALLAHMALGPANEYEPLRKQFSTLPNTLPVVEKKGIRWIYKSLPAEAKIPDEIPFKPIDVSYRSAYSPDLEVTAACYVVHSANGEDRKHHPEICIRDVLKVPEVGEARAVIALGGDKDRPVQRFAFRQGAGATTAVYYWYYVFTPVAQPDQTWLQSLYRSFSTMPPSVTVEVNVTAPPEQWPIIESSLLVALDKKLREECLPANVVMGCERLPMGLVVK